MILQDQLKITQFQNESYLIPKAIKWKSKILLEVACKLRANSILKMRKKN